MPAPDADRTRDAAPADSAGSAALTPRGERARERLLSEALRLFAEHGYERASTREICAAAQSNVAAIHYHFGGKAALYREVFLAPVRRLIMQVGAAARPQDGGAGGAGIADGDDPAARPDGAGDDAAAGPAQGSAVDAAAMNGAVSGAAVAATSVAATASATADPAAGARAAALDAFARGIRPIFAAYLAPLRDREPDSLLALRLYLRELAEPTGLIDDSMLGLAREHQSALHRLLSRTFAVDAARLDEGLRGLGVALSGLATNLLLYAPRIGPLNPGLIDSPQAVDRTLERIVHYARLLVDDELRRRAAA